MPRAVAVAAATCCRACIARRPPCPLDPRHPRRRSIERRPTISHRHGQVWSRSETARTFGVSHATSRRYLDRLVATVMVCAILPPWSRSLPGTRLVKSTRSCYSAIPVCLHHLLGIRRAADLARRPKVGATVRSDLRTDAANPAGWAPVPTAKVTVCATRSGNAELRPARGSDERPRGWASAARRQHTRPRRRGTTSMRRLAGAEAGSLERTPTLMKSRSSRGTHPPPHRKPFESVASDRLHLGLAVLP